MEDERIVALFWQRDEAAIRETAEKYGPRLRQIGRNILEDHQAVEECENDTYLRAWNSIPPHSPGAYLFAFLARIMRHGALNACKARRRRDARLTELTAELEQCLPSPSDTHAQVEGKELGEAVSAFLRTLPPERRVMFLRRYWYLDSISAIAGHFGAGESKVKSALFRTRKGLRDYLEKEGYHL